MPELMEHVVVASPMPLLAEILTHRPGQWLDPFVRVASNEGEVFATRLRATLGRQPLGTISVRKRVAITIGDPTSQGDGSIIIAVHWEAMGYAALFPVFDGRFVLRSMRPDQTVVILEGSYDPPGRLLGDIADRTVAHRAAETSLRNLLSNLRTGVEELIKQGSGTP